MNYTPFVEVPAKSSQPHSSASQSQTELHKGTPTDSLTTPSGAPALHASSQLPTGPNQSEFHTEEYCASTDSQMIPSGAQALLDVSSTPDMRDMDELVVTAVAANWQRVALRLGVEGCVSEAIHEIHPNDCEGACRDMLRHWLRAEHHTGKEERTWSSLLTALSQAGFVELERSLQREHFHKIVS